ncbi:zinc finger HIT domain-containing protein 2 [Monomorium pharaonis]|uniref:zinc finger HIT domain-containing protein 2 n=1 Tax=Monomorium pharaonis TaxID=307658 RepID=UPI00063F2499|nr:zinc finger HIT domain-containing protein 2 [Monomorium pharaonis]XP_028049219.1 zinc finger HIT domain-containing protein 2 [Monomorium pharaonis]XP_036148220.1 zinc finger HIT domain-containing protein 2 [Monomorium pharaonis]
METPGPSSSTNICELCSKRTRLYTCPRCGIGYCGAECYKSDAHTDCSESFYRQCVEDELKSQENDPAGRQKMMEILKRVHEMDMENNILEDNSDEKSSGGEDSPLDSDDEQEVLDLESRLQNINLEDPNQLWSVLSEAERQEFEALIKNGEVEKLLPKWVPWWTNQVERKLIQPVEENVKDVYSDLNYPDLIDIPLFNELQKASPYVIFNMMNVIYSYAYIALYYIGDYLNCAEEAANVFLIICGNMKNNKVFEDADSAIENVIENIKSVDWLAQDEQTIAAVREAGASILRGPGAEMKTVYISAALSELYRLLTAAKKEISIHKNGNQEFTKRFSQNRSTDVNLSKKSILLYLKKLEYYLSWTKNAGTEIL